MRGRPGSLKTKTQYQSLKDNNEVSSLSAKGRTDDFDIKVLQQKKHEAEIKRSVTWLFSRIFLHIYVVIPPCIYILPLF